MFQDIFVGVISGLISSGLLWGLNRLTKKFRSKPIQDINRSFAILLLENWLYAFFICLFPAVACTILSVIAIWKSRTSAMAVCIPVAAVCWYGLFSEINNLYKFAKHLADKISNDPTDKS